MLSGATLRTPPPQFSTKRNTARYCDQSTDIYRAEQRQNRTTKPRMSIFFGIKYRSFRNIGSGIRKKIMFFFGICFFRNTKLHSFRNTDCVLFGIFFFGIQTAFFSEYFFSEYRLRSFRNTSPGIKKCSLVHSFRNTTSDSLRFASSTIKILIRIVMVIFNCCPRHHPRPRAFSMIFSDYSGFRMIPRSFGLNRVESSGIVDVDVGEFNSNSPVMSQQNWIRKLLAI